jgi:glycosyltransferase EpsD
VAGNMRNKVLFCATVDSHFESFHLPYLKWFKEKGWEVHIAASGDLSLPYVDQKFNLSIERNPFSIKNLIAYKELKEIVDTNHYEIIHCHTPMGGVLTRLAAKMSRNTGTKLIYTAHGFHFFKGAPIVNWAAYYPIEKYLAHYTDCLIAINQEDYKIALKHRFKAKYIKHIHGVGVNTEIFFPVNPIRKLALREDSGFKQEDFLIFYAAEFNKNKNQQFLIKGFSLMKNEAPNARLLFAGDGPLLENCQKLAVDLGVEERVHFLGFRNDIEKWLRISDMAVSSSLREGLPVNIMEAMASGLPVLASDNRGHRELIRAGENGWLIKPGDVGALCEKWLLLIKNEELRYKFGISSRKLIEDQYSIDKILPEKCRLYSMFMEETEEMKWAVH